MNIEKNSYNLLKDEVEIDIILKSNNRYYQRKHL